MSVITVVFPYKKDARGAFFPIIPLSFHFRNKGKRVFALIDSGATVSIFRSEVADALGVTIEDGKEIFLGGVGGHIRGYIHNLNIEVARKSFVCPIVFSREYTVSFNLLGREAFFTQFAITFEEKKQRVELT